MNPKSRHSSYRRPSSRRGASQRGTKASMRKAAKNNLPKNAAPITLTITHIGGRGDGVGTADYQHNYQTKSHAVFVPDTLPGEEVLVQPYNLTGQGIQANLTELHTPSPSRKAPDCDASPACGGCQFQHFETQAYRTWKRENLINLLEKAAIKPAQWRDDYFAENHQRRRARLALRRRKSDVLIGFRERASHQIIYPSGCTILHPDIMAMIALLRDDLLLSLEDGMTGEAEITLCDNGCDISLHQDAPWSSEVVTKLTLRAATMPIARISLVEKGQSHTPIFVKEAPIITWQLPDEAERGAMTLTPAPASFLQADSTAEDIMRRDIFTALSGAQKILDLFSGSGTLSAALLFQSPPPLKICAYDSVPDALAAFDRIADSSGRSMHLETRARNLFDAPLTAKELEGFDAAIIDPPRAGAIAQMPALAASHIPHIIMVSCNPYSFARDAAILQDGGYDCQWARHIDQFALTAHSEIMALFTKEPLDDNAA